MKNIFKTPDNKSFIFTIPDDASVDQNGFYVIDAALRGANQHIDFDYLAHDLEYRGLSVEDTFFDRRDIMNKKISHGDYYMQFIKLDEMTRALVRHFGKEKLLASKDEHLNDIPLAHWDVFPSVQFIKTDKFKAAQNATYDEETQRRNPLMWSKSCNVCLAKTAAKAAIAKWRA